MGNFYRLYFELVISFNGLTRILDFNAHPDEIPIGLLI
jgi:hypothetical protein